MFFYYIDIDMFNLSIQANLYLIVIAITTIINWICVTILFKGQGFMMFALYTLFAIPLNILNIYNVDCLTTGNCQLWSWVLTIISTISFLIITVIIIYLTSVSSSKPIEIKTSKPSPVITPVATTTPTDTTPTTTPTTTPPVTTTPPYIGLTQEDYRKHFEQHTQKDLFISEQFKRTNLTREEKNELWLQQLELEYNGLLFAQKDIQTYLLRPNLTPEEKQLQHNMFVINQRFIKQREHPNYDFTNKSRVQYPPLIGNYFPHHIESIKLKIQLVIEQIQIIQQELLNSLLPNNQRILLQQQLRILQKMQDDLPPKPGNYLYDAYVASAHHINSSSSSSSSSSALYTPSNEPPLTSEQSLQFFEQQIQKDLYISEQFKRINLTQEEKNELWRMQLEFEYQGLLFAQKDIETYLLRPNLTPEVIKERQNMYVINKRIIKQREHPNYDFTNKSRILYPPLIGNYYPQRIESIKLKLQLITQQIQFIEKELDKSDLPAVERDALMEQLTMLQQMEYELPPKPGNYLYNAYIDPNHIDRTQSGNTSNSTPPVTR
jgi:hypothetical protein